MAPKSLPEGKFFKLKGLECNIYLTAKEECNDPGTPVVIWEEIEPRSSHQIWYEEPVSGTIRCKANHLCITINDENQLVIDEYMQGNENQMWTLDVWGGIIKNKANEELVLDVADHNTHGGSPICAMEVSGEDNQKWVLQKVPNQYFTLISVMTGMAIEAESKMMGGVKSGAKLVMGAKDQKENQLWYEDKYGILRSKVKGMGLTCDKEQGAVVRLEEYDDADPNMQWQIFPNKSIATRSMITNVLDIEGQGREKGTKVIVWQNMGADNQKWNIEYFGKKKKSKKASAEADSDDDEDDDED